MSRNSTSYALMPPNYFIFDRPRASKGVQSQPRPSMSV